MAYPELKEKTEKRLDTSSVSESLPFAFCLFGYSGLQF